MLEVLGRTNSINVRKVLWTCEELGLERRIVEWGRGELSLRSPEYLALNPNGLVPVLRDGDFVLWESNTICRYLAARERREDLLPSPPRARAQVERWMDWQAGDLNNAWRYAFMALVRQSPEHTDATQVERSVAAWNRHMAILDGALAAGGPCGGAFVCGAAFTLADVVLGLATHRWFSTPLERPALAHVGAYYARLSERPGFLAWGRNGQP